MADDAGTRLRNVSDYGDIEVPDLNVIVPSAHEVVVEDTDLAQRLIDTGHFIAVGKPGPKTGTDSTSSSSSSTSSAGSSSSSSSAPTTTSTPSGAGTDTSTEGTNQ